MSENLALSSVSFPWVQSSNANKCDLNRVNMCRIMKGAHIDHLWVILLRECAIVSYTIWELDYVFKLMPFKLGLLYIYESISYFDYIWIKYNKLSWNQTYFWNILFLKRERKAQLVKLPNTF